MQIHFSSLRNIFLPGVWKKIHRLRIELNVLELGVFYCRAIYCPWNRFVRNLATWLMFFTCCSFTLHPISLKGKETLQATCSSLLPTSPKLQRQLANYFVVLNRKKVLICNLDLLPNKIRLGLENLGPQRRTSYVIVLL